MSDVIIKQKPKKFPEEYIKEINNALSNTITINGVGSLHKKILYFIDTIFQKESIDSSIPGSDYIQLDTLLYELKTIYYMADNDSFSNLIYEPLGIDSEGKKIDLFCEYLSVPYLIELKSTHPKTIAPRVPTEKFTADTLQANPLYYGWISSARSHFLEFLVNTEKKLENYSAEIKNALCIYKNFHVEEDELQYLWFFYKNGVPHEADAFGGMMQYEVERKKIFFSKAIDELWAIGFPQFGFEKEYFILLNDEMLKRI